MGVKVKRERADQRRHHRVQAPLYVEFAGARHKAADWSLGGLRLEAVANLPEPGTRHPVHLSLPFQGFEVSFDAVIEIVRVDAAAQMFAATFAELGERERELMQHFIEELVRGSMVDVQDTIQRIDVPVTPASLEPDKPKGVSAVPVRRWPIRAIAMTGLYGVGGLMMFGYAALLGYSNFFRLEVQTAVISAPIETVASVSDGRIAWSGAKPGESVRAGDVIVSVVDSELERDLELADIAVKERKAQLLFLKNRQADELARMRSLTTLESKNLDQARIEVETIEAQLQAAEQQLGRVAHLHRKGFSTDARLEEVEKLVATLKKTLESRRVELKSRVELANQNDGRWHYTGNDIVGNLSQIESQIRLAEHETALTQRKLEALQTQKKRLAVRAPFDGTVLELPHIDNGAVRRGDVIAILEQRRQRQVTAFLTQDEVLRVGRGDEVVLYVPALKESLKGRVIQIDRTSGFVQEQLKAQPPNYRWRSNVDRSAKVIIAFADPARVQDVERYRSGMPVVVVFPRNSSSAITSTIAEPLRSRS